MSESHRPQRTCLGCRKVLEREELLRFVLSPQKEVVVDYRGKLPGRGAYTCLNRQCLLEALRRRQFARAFRDGGVTAEAETLTGQLLAQLGDRLLGLIGMARKSHQLVSGSSLVLDRLASGHPPVLVILAEDVSPAIGEKVEGRAARRSIACFRKFDKELLGRVLGTAERSVLALEPGPLAVAIRLELERYQRIAGEL